MQPDLQPKDTLSQVVFVHDHLQLVFQDCSFTLYNVATYTQGSLTLRQGQAGFCDALVELIDQPARIELRSGKLVLQFLGGASISVPNSGQDVRGPEAWQFGRLGGPQVVEQNA